MYSVTGKQCPQALIEKSLVFLTANLYEILHASTYGIYNYIYKIKISAADGNPELYAFCHPWSPMPPAAYPRRIF